MVAELLSLLCLTFPVLDAADSAEQGYFALAHDVRRLSSCGTGLAADPNDFSSLSVMLASGWSCINCDNLITHNSNPQEECSGTPSGSFCGYSQTSDLFELRMVLSGAGVLSLDFSSIEADWWRETKAWMI
eukprot:Skav202878  [mRNA]  locus=scaffold1401:20112:27792:- [translate_table: standard]